MVFVITSPFIPILLTSFPMGIESNIFFILAEWFLYYLMQVL